MKVAVVTNFDKKNYGSVLQSYALQNKLEELGAEEHVIFQRSFNNKTTPFERFYRFFKKSENSYSLKNKIEIKRAKKFFSSKYKKINEFCMKNIKEVSCISDKEARNLANDYDFFIAGSDQIWSPRSHALSPYTLLNFVNPSNTKKYSYAASIGVKELSDQEIDLFKEHLDEFDEISVREETARNVLKSCTDKKIRVDIDPTLLYDGTFWQKLIIKQEKNEPYIFVYTLRPEPFTIDLAKELSKITGIKVKICSNRIVEKSIFENVTDAGIEDFLSLIYNAEYVVTNSFHGTVFSLLFHKRFLSVAIEGTGSRVSDLLKKLDLSNHSISEINNINEIFNEIDWNRVENSLKEYRSDSLNYLKSIIDLNKENDDSIELYKHKEECCGCGACMNICPKGAITMDKDIYGFVYPKIDKTKCVKCGLCKKICGYQNKQSENKILKAYASVGNEKSLIKKSASGGVFATIAHQFLEEGGKVFGCALEKKDNRLIPNHIMINSVDELYKLQGSKYVQSNINFSYKLVLEQLKQGNKVLFSGTPCQIVGLNSFLQYKKYNNLFTIELVCHGVPNADIFQGYLDYKSGVEKKKIENIKFRDKKYGWQEKGTILFKKDKKEIKKNISIYNSSYYRLYIASAFYRENCYKCNCKGINRHSDITIGDFWGIEKNCPQLLNKNGGKFNSKEGISCVFVNSTKGKDLIDNFGKELILEEVQANDIIQGNAAIIKSSKSYNDRNKLLSIFYNDGYIGVKKWYIKKYWKRMTFLNIWTRIPKSLRNKLKKLKKMKK